MQIRQMTLIDVDRITRHIRGNPTLRTAVCAIAARLGIEFKPQEPKKYTTSEEFAALVRATGGKIDGIGRM